MRRFRRGSAVLFGLLAVSACGGGPTPPTPAASASRSIPVPSGASAEPSERRLPTFASDEALMLFALRTDLGGGVFVMRPDGSRVQLGTDALPGVHKVPDWSPDGLRVAFIDQETGRLLIAHLDGSPTQSVAACEDPGCDNPAWSPH